MGLYFDIALNEGIPPKSLIIICTYLSISFQLFNYCHCCCCFVVVVDDISIKAANISQYSLGLDFIVAPRYLANEFSFPPLFLTGLKGINVGGKLVSDRDGARMRIPERLVTILSRPELKWT